MRDDELREFERNVRAAIVAGLAGLLLGGIGLWAAANREDRALGGVLCGGFAAAIFGAAVGVAGASARSLGRAAVIGVGIAGLFVAFPMSLAGSLVEPRIDRLWFFAALCSLGSILAQIGAVVGGTAATPEKPARMRQFTIRQLMALFIPVAVYFGYVSAHMRR
jgi:hypothetical protein